MIHRDIAKVMEKWALGFKALTVTGPRQSGKTTLARKLFPDLEYVSLENPDLRERARTDPRGFLSRLKNGAVLDEVQRAPDLFSYLQQILDEEPRTGRFVFTGSQQFGLMESLSQSLAGRCGLLTLLPFSHAELDLGGHEAGSVAERVVLGGYPPLYEPGAPWEPWMNAYISTYLERDVRQVLEVRNLETFHTFLRLCAGSVAGELNLNRLGADAGINHGTARQWISVLQASHVIHLLPAYHENFRKRLVKRPKLIFLDTGLASRLIGLETADQWWTHPLRGALFENWVVSELLKSRYNQGRAPALSYWRENNGLEVDLIREEGGKLWPMEIKSGATYTPDWGSKLEKWRRLAGERAGEATVVYGGEDSFVHRDIRVSSWRTLGKDV